jgi:hypothetical protein
MRFMLSMRGEFIFRNRRPSRGVHLRSMNTKTNAQKSTLSRLLTGATSPT